MAPHPPLPEFMNLEELSALARNCMTKQAYEYYASGAETETSVADNRSAFEDYRIVPRILVDVSSVDTSSHLYGELRQHNCATRPPELRADRPRCLCCPAGYRMAMPVMVAPMAMHGLSHADKEVRTRALTALQSLGFGHHTASGFCEPAICFGVSAGWHRQRCSSSGRADGEPVL